MIKRLVLYIVAVLYLGVCWSQEKFPVAVNAQLIAPYSLYLDDYTSEYKERIGIVLLNRDTYYPSMEVKLRFTIKSNGLVLTSNPYGRYLPIVLDAGS